MEEKRILYYVKILAHTSEELGSLANPLAKIKKISLKAYDEMAYRFWRRVRQNMKSAGLNEPEICRKLHIYVDGLTAQPFYCKTCFDKTGEKRYMDGVASNKIRCSFCGRLVEAEVEEFLLRLTKALIEEKVPQYLIIEKLMERGAKIRGTESQALFIEEHNIWQEVAQGIPSKPGQKERLLEERDKFIANIINRTLPSGEIGVLFIGALHDVAKELDELEESGKLISPLKVIYL